MINERRSRTRTALRLPLFLLSNEASILINTETENVNLYGFFWYSDRLFLPGERLRFLLMLSGGRAEPPLSRTVYLDGVVEVVHVTVETDLAKFGLGCQVSSSRVLLDADFHTLEDIAAFLAEPYQPEESGHLEVFHFFGQSAISQ